MGNLVFWILIAIMLAAAAVAGLSVYLTRGRRKPIARGEEPKQVTAGGDEEPLVTAPSVETEPVAEPAETTEVVEEPAAEVVEPQVEEVEQPRSRMARLRRRLASSNNALAKALADLLSSDNIDDDTWDDFETTLITSDLGVGPSTELVETLRKRLSIDGIDDPAQAKEALREELVKLVDPSLDRSLNLDHEEGKPAVLMMVGVNGTGKTTTVGKLGRVLVAEDKKVLFGAADTFRAAAAEQLTTWGDRVGVQTIRGEEGADPASIAFNAVDAGIEQGVDVVLVDTAGRLHTKTGLMDELGKVKRVMEKQGPIAETLLVLDATTGQNGLRQAEIFAQVVDVSGVVLTKLDGSAKGGIVVSVQKALGVPVKLVGLGEGADDLAPFSPEDFVDAIVG